MKSILLVLILLLAARDLSAQTGRLSIPNAVKPGDSVQVALIPPTVHRSAGSLRYEAGARSGVLVAGPLAGLVTWPAESTQPVYLPIRYVVPLGTPAGSSELGSLQITWANGARQAVPVTVQVGSAEAQTTPRIVAHASGDSAGALPTADIARAGSTERSPSHVGQEWASIQVGGLTKEVDVELYGTTRSTSPGGLVVIRWAFNSYEDQDERVRLRVELPEGWVLLDRDVLERELLLESWETLEGELRVTVPRDAKPGDRHMIRMSGTVVGEPGSAEVYSYVQLQRRGGLKPGQVGLTGTVSLQSTSFALESYEGARYGGVVDLSSRLTSRTTVSLNYRQGPREDNLTNYRIAQEDTRWSGMLRSPSFQLQVGNQLTSMGTAITGPSVRAQGASVRRTQGLVVGDLLAAQPTTFDGDAAGHIVRGSVGLSGQRGRLLATVSDFGRPAGGYSTTPRYPEDIPPDSLEKLERERKALEKAARNRVQGAGLDAELRLGKVHRLSARGGWMKLHNSTGDTIDQASTEVQYALSHPVVNANVRWRNMPTSLTGVYLPGDEVSFDGSVKLVGELRLAGRAYRTLVETLGSAYRSENEGASLGVRYYRQGWRFDLRASQREWSYNTGPTVARTMTLSFGLPIGPLNFNGFADVGEQDNGSVRQPTSSYRGDLRWAGTAGSVSWGASRYESLSAAPRLRTDLLGSLKLGEWELAGGAWATRGWTVGGEPGYWTQVGMPVSFDLLLTAGVEHAPPDYGKPPMWLGTLGVRKRLTLPVPFLRSPGVAGGG